MADNKLFDRVIKDSLALLEENKRLFELTHASGELIKMLSKDNEQLRIRLNELENKKRKV